jgi:hypothetical protein
MGKAEAENLGVFAPTQWSLVDRAAQSGLEGRRELGVLLQRYLPALRAHLRIQKRLSAEQVEELLQGFVAEKVVEQNLVAHADQAKGKFRSFLLIALDRFVIDQNRRACAAKRAAREGAEVSLDDQAAAGMGAIARNPEPSRQFNIAWAQELIRETLGRMKKECEESGQWDVWVIFESRVLCPAFDGEQPISYEDLVQRLNLQAPIQAANLLTTAKRKFTRILRSVVGEYAGDEKRIDQEILDLKSIISDPRA